MAWLRLTICSRLPCLEDLGDLLEKFDASSISYTSGSDEAIFGDDSSANEYWEKTAVSALFPADIDIDILVACIRNKLGPENVLDYVAEPVKEESWDESLKIAFQPLVFSHRLCICPSWHSRPPDIANIVELDPGLAFGTGAHATTSLCLQWLADNEVTGKAVIDYGCGSGILGLAAARLGARSVVAVDIDPQALLATDDNARKNQLEAVVQAVFPDDACIRQADILLANILLNPLLQLSSTFKNLLGSGGQIVLSGILANQAAECAKDYSQWFDLDEPVFQGEWAMLAGIRKQEI